MDVGVVVVRRVEVDHVRDAVDIDAPGGDVGGHQRVDAARPEAGERPLALALRLVAVDRERLHATVAEPFDEPVGAPLGAHEHQRAIALAAELVHQRLQAGVLADRDEAVLDVGCLVAARLTLLVGDRPLRIARRDAAGDAIEGCREEQRLALRRAGGDDAIDRRAKAHVEHPVGLVEHEDPDRIEREGATLEQILQAPGSGDQDVRLRGQRRLLGEAHPTVYGRDTQVARADDVCELLDDLAGELAGWRQHEGGWAGRHVRLGSDAFVRAAPRRRASCPSRWAT